MAQKTMQRCAQYSVIEEFAEEKPEGVKVWDFGDSQTVMPVPDMASGSYLTSLLCVLYIEGTKDAGPSALEGKLLPRKDEEIFEYDGWKFIAVEFSLMITGSELAAKLEKAKDKLLGR